jgi:hypothetical protein
MSFPVPDINKFAELISGDYVETIKTIEKSYSRRVEVTYIEMNNFFQLCDDIRENVSSLIGIVAFLIACGAFISMVMYGDKIILIFKYLPNIINNLNLLKI